MNGSIDSKARICGCGCGMPARWLMTGQDYDGAWFYDEPACESSAGYCQESARELDRPLTLKKIQD